MQRKGLFCRFIIEFKCSTMNHKLFKNKNEYLLIAIIFGLHYSCKADLLKGVCKKKNSVNILIKIYNSGINTSILVRSQF